MSTTLWRVSVWLSRHIWYWSRPAPRTYGHDRLATLSDLKRAGLFSDTGLFIGMYKGHILRSGGDGHATMIAPPRSGKGTNFIIPNLLEPSNANASIICTDPKGENRDITMRHRATLGPVYVLDAAQPWASHQLNPFDHIRPTAHAVDDAMHLAGLLVTPDPKEGGHWNAKATNLLAGMILTIHATKPKARHTLTELFRLAMGGDAALKLLLHDMAQLPFPTITAIAQDMLGLLDTREGRSILSTVHKHLALWAPDRPASRLVQASDFQLAEFMQRPCTLYIVIPGDKAEMYAPFMRLFTGLALAAMTREARPSRHPVLFLLDEARLLGRLDDLSRLIAFGAGYGVRAIPIWQDERQVAELYGSTSLIDQCGLQLYLSVNSPEKAAELSRRCGQYTVRPRSTGQTGRVESILDRTHNHGEGEAGRPVLYPAEIMHSDALFAFAPKVPAIRCTPVPYFKAKRFDGHWDRWADQRPHHPQPASIWEGGLEIDADTPIALPRFKARPR